MASTAIHDSKNRIIKVKRTDLIKTLKQNKKKHQKDYQEAVAGYKAEAIAKLRKAHEDAKVELEKNVKRGLASIEEFNPADTSRYHDTLTLVRSITVELKVPRDYSEHYDAAIARSEWDVRPTLELSDAEFQCFVRDIWDWSDEFKNTTMLYSNSRG